MALFIKKTACIIGKSISKRSLLGVLRDTSEGDFLSSLDQSAWRIISYDVRTGEACVDLLSNNGTRRISITLPNLRFATN